MVVGVDFLNVDGHPESLEAWLQDSDIQALATRLNVEARREDIYDRPPPNISRRVFHLCQTSTRDIIQSIGIPDF